MLLLALHAKADAAAGVARAAAAGATADAAAGRKRRRHEAKQLAQDAWQATLNIKDARRQMLAKGFSKSHIANLLKPYKPIEVLRDVQQQLGPAAPPPAVADEDAEPATVCPWGVWYDEDPIQALRELQQQLWLAAPLPAVADGEAEPEEGAMALAEMDALFDGPAVEQQVRRQRPRRPLQPPPQTADEIMQWFEERLGILSIVS